MSSTPVFLSALDEHGSVSWGFRSAIRRPIAPLRNEQGPELGDVDHVAARTGQRYSGRRRLRRAPVSVPATIPPCSRITSEARMRLAQRRINQ